MPKPGNGGAPETLLVTDTRGRIGNGMEGFYLHRTRFLSRLGIKVDEAEPTLRLRERR